MLIHYTTLIHRSSSKLVDVFACMFLNLANLFGSEPTLHLGLPLGFRSMLSISPCQILSLTDPDYGFRNVSLPGYGFSLTDPQFCCQDAKEVTRISKMRDNLSNQVSKLK